MPVFPPEHMAPSSSTLRSLNNATKRAQPCFSTIPDSIAKPRSYRFKRTFSAEEFNTAVLLVQVLGIVLLASATGHAYLFAVYGDWNGGHDFAPIGALVAVLYALPHAYGGYHRLSAPQRSNQDLRRVFSSWNFAFLCILFVAFLTNSQDDFSGGWILLFYVVGSFAIVASEVAILAVRKAAIKSGRLTTRRVFLVGSRTKVGEFERRCRAEGIEIVGAAVLPEFADSAHPDAFEKAHASLQSAVAAARRNNVSNIVILTDRCQARESAKIAEQFLDLPAAVHLQGLDIVEQFSQVRIDHLGTMKSLVVRPQPLSSLQSFAKRTFDIAAASVALLLLVPLLGAVALSIRLDSPGPAIFVQRRRGFNHREFRIYKFRTMTTRDDGAQIVQATENDPRITRVGRILRKYNIDELPQLVNVFLGDMSLVGPRPHAVAHDAHYEQIINRYGRRLNMRPGITGWAQINGLRGETKTKAAMEARLNHDLDYIDNWSIALDIYVLIMTVVSRRAYANAV